MNDIFSNMDYLLQSKLSIIKKKKRSLTRTFEFKNFKVFSNDSGDGEIYYKDEQIAVFHSRFDSKEFLNVFNQEKMIDFEEKIYRLALDMRREEKLKKLSSLAQKDTLKTDMQSRSFFLKAKNIFNKKNDRNLDF